MKTLKHYSSPYYDPAKAHEYYMKNRELKGRTTKGMSKDQREAWSYAKGQISTEKKSVVKSASENKDQQIEQMRARAEQTRARISQKLEALSQKLMNDSATKREALSKKLSDQIEKLTEPIPENTPPRERARLLEKRKKELAKIQNGIRLDKANLTNDTQSKQAKASNDATTQRAQTATQLKAAITTARDNYKKLRADIDSSYEKKYQDEYDNIRSKVK